MWEEEELVNGLNTLQVISYFLCLLMKMFIYEEMWYAAYSDSESYKLPVKNYACD